VEEDGMEIRPGMFVLSAEAAEWEPDPEVPGTAAQVLVHDGPIQAGQTRITDAPEPLTWTPEHREVFLVLEGRVRIEFADGSDVDLGVGDMASIPAGLTTTWHVTTPFREMWVLAEG
jgi:uncharacterized cupin superfamily protein